MKKIGRSLLALLCGFLIAFVLDCFAFTPIKQHVQLQYPFQIIMEILTAGILACFFGGEWSVAIFRKNTVL